MADIARKVGSKDSCFSHFLIFLHRDSIREGNKEIFSLVLSPFTVKEEGRERARDSFSDRKTKSSDDPLYFETNSSRIWISGATRMMGKLEDLVRLALKRLNVSYLTILSRLVWYETRNVCVS